MINRTIRIVSVTSFIFLSSCASLPVAKAATSSSVGCTQDPDKQKLRSEELQAIVKADQDDREGPVSSIDWSEVQPRDEQRRKRIGEIFGEGCFKSAADYAAAALVYQHGNVPDHFFQTFLWAKKAVELGDSSKNSLMALGIDRYLVNIGHKQLFGTQFSSSDPKTNLWCIEPVEKTFPDSRRIEYLKMNLRDSIAVFLKFYKSGQTPEDVQDCDHILKPSAAGIVPGFW